MIIDVHTHAFPDRLAARAMAQLQAETDQVIAVLDGTIADLLRSMDRAGIHAAVVASIATRPSQFDPILRWSDSIRSDRIVPFPSFCPLAPEAVDQVRHIAAEGFLGFKLHPYYQQFVLDDPRLDPVYAVAAEAGLIVLLHSGFDLAFPHDRVADPVRIRRLIDRFPALRVIAAHLGAWQDWDEVEHHLLGRDIYFDVSCSLDFMRPEQALRILRGHRADRLLFGSDSPWVDQARTIEQLRALGLGSAAEAQLLERNARALLRVPAALPT